MMLKRLSPLSLFAQQIPKLDQPAFTLVLPRIASAAAATAKTTKPNTGTKSALTVNGDEIVRSRSTAIAATHNCEQVKKK